MHNKQIQIIDWLTPLIVYTLEFIENANDECFTLEKLTEDYERLIAEVKVVSSLSEETFDTSLLSLA